MPNREGHVQHHVTEVVGKDQLRSGASSAWRHSDLRTEQAAQCATGNKVIQARQDPGCRRAGGTKQLQRCGPILEMVVIQPAEGET